MRNARKNSWTYDGSRWKNKAVEDRIKQAKTAWISLRTLIANNSVDKNLKIMLFDSLISSMILYGLNTLNVKTQIGKLQKFYSGCIRYIIYGKYEDKQEKMVNNTKIREDLNIPTIESRL